MAADIGAIGAAQQNVLAQTQANQMQQLNFQNQMLELNGKMNAQEQDISMKSAMQQRMHKLAMKLIDAMRG